MMNEQADLECRYVNSPLVEVDAHALQVEVDLIYAGVDNLAGKQIYQDPRCLLHRDAERCLRKASRLARQAGFRLKIFDAYRPAYAQYMLWQALPNPECDCFGQRYECFAQCYGNQQCRQACQLAYDDCRTGCFGG